MFRENSDFTGYILQFTLTCISSGGPATNVTWTRNSEAVADGMRTVLNDSVNAIYTHTLTVTGRLGGHYQCIVSNNKPSSDSSNISLQGDSIHMYIVCVYVVQLLYTTVASEPTNLRLKQDGPMKIVVSWDPPSPPGHTTGYRVYYTTTQSTTEQCNSTTDTTMDISDITTITLTELTGGCYYTVFVAGLSEHLPSEEGNETIYLGMIK